MPLREERKVLSTAKPSSPAAVPSSGGRSRRLQALNISTRPTGYSPRLPPAQDGKQEDGNLAGRESRQEQEWHCEKPQSEAGRPAVGPRRRRPRGAGGGTEIRARLQLPPSGAAFPATSAALPSRAEPFAAVPPGGAEPARRAQPCSSGRGGGRRTAEMRGGGRARAARPTSPTSPSTARAGPPRPLRAPPY